MRCDSRRMEPGATYQRRSIYRHVRRSCPLFLSTYIFK
jgi:hypothetical protein